MTSGLTGQPEIEPIAWTIAMRVRPFVGAIQRYELAGGTKPRTVPKIVIETELKNTSTKVPTNSAT